MERFRKFIVPSPLPLSPYLVKDSNTIYKAGQILLNGYLLQSRSHKSGLKIILYSLFSKG